MPSVARRPLMPVLAALSLAHLLNDLVQSMIPALYPLIKDTYQLDFMQIGFITLAFQVTSSLLQPLLGYVTDRRPWPYAMVAGMCSTLTGLLLLSFAHSYAVTDAPEDVVLARTSTEGGPFASLVGRGPVVAAQFHPERSSDAGRALLAAVLAWAEVA